MAFDIIPTQEGGKFKAVASGALPSGQPVIVNSDGTVTKAGLVSFPETVGAAVVVENSQTSDFSATYDSTNKKVIVTYRDSSNSNYGTAVVGTVSGSTISFGAPVIFNSGTSLSVSATFDSQNNKVVVFYFNGGTASLGVVGTVSGTTISFGSPVTFFSGRGESMSSAFDTDTGAVFVAFKDNSLQGRGKAVVGTVSGDSISFGSPREFNSFNSNFFSTAYDSANQKAVIIHWTSNGIADIAIVGTISGTSITFGNPVVLGQVGSSATSITFEPNAGKVVVGYQDSGASRFGTARVGTISGTSISFGTPTVFNSNQTYSVSSTFHAASGKVLFFYRNFNTDTRTRSATVSGTSISFGAVEVIDTSPTGGDITVSVYDAESKKAVFLYSDNDDSAFLKALTYNPLYTGTNLTEENFIGISSGGAVADTGNATVDIVGTINNELSGLNSGQNYFVQSNGSLSTTADTPQVLAGTAISATSLLVKG